MADLDDIRDGKDFGLDKPQTNKAFYGTPAAGSIMHFQGLVFSKKAGIELTHVPYRGMAAIVPDLISGNLMASMAVLGDLLQHLDSGKLRVLAVTSAKRSRFVPNVPTFAELGMPEVTGVDWYGLFLPAKTPPELVAKLHATTSAAVKEASFADSLAQLGFEPYQLMLSGEFAKGFAKLLASLSLSVWVTPIWLAFMWFCYKMKPVQA